MLARTFLFLSLITRVAQPQSPLVVDGSLDDAFWRAIEPKALVPQQPGTPGALGGETRAGLRGGYLVLSARLPEPGGKISARSFGRNPIWERDATESPEVEDRVEFRLRWGARDVAITLNPWGAYRIEEHGRAVTLDGLLAAARIESSGWTIETSLPLTTFAGSVDVRALRIRARRPLAPELRWMSQHEVAVAAAATASETPAFRPPPLGNIEPPLEVGRVPVVPPVIANWNDPAWRDVPAFELPRNEPYPRAPRHRTQVKWVHDGQKLALLCRLEEPGPVVARSGGQDSAVTGDDHIAIYFATSGSSFLEIATNSVGAIRDSRAIGPHAMRPQSGWDADVEVQTDIRHGAWFARIDLPLPQLAAGLGETGMPSEWRVALTRYRARRREEPAESSALPPLGTSTFYGPLRYRRMVLRDTAPAAVAKVAMPWLQPAGQGLARELALLDPHVWSELERRKLGVTSMLEARLRRRAEEAVWAERQEWEKVRTREDWERFRDTRIAALTESFGRFPPERPPLDVRVSARHTGKGYRLENLVFQSRPGFYMTANLYLPERPAARMPAMIIVHSQHFPKTQGELHDMGELWARTGAAVLVIERPGYGERAETSAWYRQAYGSRFTFSKQLFLVGESYSGWAAWDIIRSVDFLHERSDVDHDRIILLGSVAGGGEPSGVAAALDPRIDAVVPFNYDQGHIRVHGDSPGQIAKQFSPWLVAASVAPRRFVRAFEFGWEGAEEHDYPSLWVDGLERSRKVWSFYGAQENLAGSQAYGLIRLSMERVSHCFSIGPQQRLELYPVFQRWFGIPFPSKEDLAILPDSQLSVSAAREEARRQEAQRRRPHADLLSITPELSAQLKRRKMHELAHDMGVSQLQAARARRQSVPRDQRGRRLRDELAPLLGDITPGEVAARALWSRTLSGASVEAVALNVEEGIQVPLLMVRPNKTGPTPAVVAISHGGKERFLVNRAAELERLIQSGIAICLPDVRGTGETSPSPDRNRDGGAHHGLAQMESDLGRNLLGARLKDVRSVIAYLRARSDVNRNAISLWGDSFSPPNSPELYLDELEYEVSPQIQHRSEPMGAMLALLSALYEDGVRAIAAQGGLTSYLSVLDNAFTYTPMDAIVLGLLKVADVADIIAALEPRPVLYERVVDGRNVAVPGKTSDQITWLINASSSR